MGTLLWIDGNVLFVSRSKLNDFISIYFFFFFIFVFFWMEEQLLKSLEWFIELQAIGLNSMRDKRIFWHKIRVTTSTWYMRNWCLFNDWDAASKNGETTSTTSYVNPFCEFLEKCMRNSILSDTTYSILFQAYCLFGLCVDSNLAMESFSLKYSTTIGFTSSIEEIISIHWIDRSC